MGLVIDYVKFLEVGASTPKALGFATHEEETVKALLRAGVRFDKGAEIALHICPPHLIRPVIGKRNVLYTAIETPDLPQELVDGAAQADLIVAPSTFAQQVLQKHVPQVPVALCHEGVDTATFCYVKRKYSEPFVYLWVGAPNERKGWTIIKDAWKQFAHDPTCMLVVKTTATGKVHKADNVIVDGRKLPRYELAKIFKYAHCFLFPSYAEGFGLPLAEAMATGMPCIYTPWSGVVDFASRKNAYPLKYRISSVQYGIMTHGAVADVHDLVRQMIKVRNDYQHALKVRGKRARRTIEENFTWDHTGRRLRAILEDFANGAYRQGRSQSRA